MADPSRRPQAEQRGLSDEELAAEQSGELPDREAMSLLDFGFNVEDIDNLNLAVPINRAIASNINTTSSIANADADQVVVIDQGLDNDDNLKHDPDDSLEHHPVDRI